MATQKRKTKKLTRDCSDISGVLVISDCLSRGFHLQALSACCSCERCIGGTDNEWAGPPPCQPKTLNPAELTERSSVAERAGEMRDAR